MTTSATTSATTAMDTSSASSFERSLWSASAAEPPLGLPALAGERRVDLAVLGGGITGVSAALRAASGGSSVALLEAREIGWGASGRNGGQVIPGLKLDPPELRAAYGEERGNAIADAVGQNADLVFDLVATHAIACAPARGGWVQAAHAPSALPRIQRRARVWQERGAPVELLDRDALAALTGARGYHGGWIDRRAGTLQPLGYTRGLARAARAAGAALHERSRVTGIRREGDLWRLSTEGGSVLARKVAIGQDGYTDATVQGLERTLLVVQSAQIATEPLPEALRARLMPGGLCLSETRRLAFYCRQSPDGRIVFGGRGAVGGAENPRFTEALIGAMRRIFPEAATLPIAHRWSGQIAMTLDGLPHLHEAAPGLYAGLGYNGRGVAMATLMGQWLADLATERRAPPLPLTPIVPIRWHGLRRPAIAAGIAWAWLRDRAGMAD